MAGFLEGNRGPQRESFAGGVLGGLGQKCYLPLTEVK